MVWRVPTRELCRPLKRALPFFRVYPGLTPWANLFHPLCGLDFGKCVPHRFSCQASPALLLRAGVKGRAGAGLPDLVGDGHAGDDHGQTNMVTKHNSKFKIES